MKTLADLKRKIQLGVKLELQHLQTGWTPGVREVCLVQTNQFGLKTVKKDGTTTTSYCSFPKAKDLKIENENTFTIMGEWYVDGKEQYVPILKYTFVG